MRSSNSNPSMPGSCTSHSATSNRRSVTRSSADSALGHASTEKPSCVRYSASVSRINGSSSTTRIGGGEAGMRFLNTVGQRANWFGGQIDAEHHAADVACGDFDSAAIVGEQAARDEQTEASAVFLRREIRFEQ